MCQTSSSISAAGGELSDLLYSVAEHSVLVSKYALEGLLGDVSSPLKKLPTQPAGLGLSILPPSRQTRERQLHLPSMLCGIKSSELQKGLLKRNS
jgi:hypothetical protein